MPSAAATSTYSSHDLESQRQSALQNALAHNPFAPPPMHQQQHQSSYVYSESNSNTSSSSNSHHHDSTRTKRAHHSSSTQPQMSITIPPYHDPFTSTTIKPLESAIAADASSSYSYDDEAMMEEGVSPDVTPNNRAHIREQRHRQHQQKRRKEYRRDSTSSSSSCTSWLHSRLSLLFVLCVLGFVAVWHFGGNELGVDFVRITTLQRGGLRTNAAGHSHSHVDNHLTPSSLSSLTLTSSSLTSSSSTSSMPHLLIRILSSGQHHHTELSRCLTSLTSASYHLGLDLIDVEIILDTPYALTQDAIQGRNLTLLRKDAYYQQMKYEHDLHIMIAKAFAWNHGSVSVKVQGVETRGKLATADEIGLINMFVNGEFHPLDNKKQPTQTIDSQYVLILRDTNVVSPMYFQFLKGYFSLLNRPSSTTQSSSTVVESAKVEDPDEEPLNPDKIMSLILEPGEIVLGVPDAADGSGGVCDAKRRYEEVFVPPPTGVASQGRLSFIHLQQLPSFSIYGGLLFSSSRLHSFRLWLARKKWIRQKYNDQSILSEWILSPFIKKPSEEDLCVPGVIANGWFSTSMKSSVPETQQSRQAAWYLMALLQRYEYEHALWNVAPMFQPAFESSNAATAVASSSSSSPVLITSSAFEISYTHSHIHALHLSSHGDGHDGHSENEEVAEEEAVLPKLKRRLVGTKEMSAFSQEDWSQSGLQSASDLNTNENTLVYDFTTILLPASKLYRHSPVICKPIINAPPAAPTNEPTEEEMKEYLAPILAAAAVAMAGRNETGNNSSLSTDLPASTLSQAELLSIALHTSTTNHTYDLTFVPLEVDPLSPLVPPHLLLDNLTLAEHARWDEYETEYQLGLITEAWSKRDNDGSPSSLPASITTREQYMNEYARQQQIHESHLAHIQSELDKKALLESVTKQLAKIKKQEAMLADEMRRIQESERKRLEALKKQSDADANMSDADRKKRINDERVRKRKEEIAAAKRAKAGGAAADPSVLPEQQSGQSAAKKLAEAQRIERETKVREEKARKKKEREEKKKREAEEADRQAAEAANAPSPAAPATTNKLTDPPATATTPGAT